MLCLRVVGLIRNSVFRNIIGSLFRISTSSNVTITKDETYNLFTLLILVMNAQWEQKRI